MGSITIKKNLQCIRCLNYFNVDNDTQQPYICENCKKIKNDKTLLLELAEENLNLKKILRDIRNINSHGNMEYFGESVMEILNNADKSLWEEK